MKKNLVTIALIIIIILLAFQLTNVKAFNRFSMSYLYGNYDFSSLVQRTGNQLNEVSPNYFELNSDGSLLCVNVNTSFINEMHSKNIKVVPFITNNWDRTLGRTALANSENLSTQIADAIKAYNLDGVNIDIENVTGLDTLNYTNFVKLTRDKIGYTKTVVVSVAANPYNWTSGWQASYDYTELAKYADYLMVIAYDEHYEGGVAGPVASIDFTEKSVQYAISKADKSKIVLGIPFYGRYWQDGATYGGYGVSLSKIETIVNTYHSEITYSADYQSVCAKVTIYDTDAKLTINGRTLTSGTYTFWYENENSITAKLNMINKYDIKGVGSWSLGQETASTWNYFYNVLNGYTSTNTDTTNNIINTNVINNTTNTNVIDTNIINNTNTNTINNNTITNTTNTNTNNTIVKNSKGNTKVKNTGRN